MKKLFVSAIALFAAASLSAQDVTALYNEAAAASAPRISRERPPNSNR